MPKSAQHAVRTGAEADDVRGAEDEADDQADGWEDESIAELDRDGEGKGQRTASHHCAHLHYEEVSGRDMEGGARGETDSCLLPRDRPCRLLHLRGRALWLESWGLSRSREREVVQISGRGWRMEVEEVERELGGHVVDQALAEGEGPAVLGLAGLNQEGAENVEPPPSNIPRA